LLESQR
jgi:hypothetical protein